MTKIFFGVPTIDRRIDVDCMLSIFRHVMQDGGQTYFHMGISDIALARNIVVQKFLKSECDWLMMVDSDIIFKQSDWDFLWEGPEDLVTGAYARKIPGKAPANYGLGFTRVHRRVFEQLEQQTNDDGQESLQRFYLDGEMVTHFFPVGPSGDNRWIGEDRGFFTLCQLNGFIEHRLETRCTLEHVGYFKYGYPVQDNGVQWWSGQT